MDDKEIKEKLRVLEDEIDELKKTLPDEKKPSWIVRQLRSLNKTFSTYQSLIYMIIGLGTLGYVFFIYGQGPFQTYKNAYFTDRLSDFYRKMGDKMLRNAEYAEAETEYKAALKLKENNYEANLGLAKTQIFQPQEGQKYNDQNVIDMKLDYLLKSMPEDPDIYFLKCVNFASVNRSEEAKSFCRTSIEMYGKKMLVDSSPDIREGSASPEISLGFLSMKEFNFDDAFGHYQKALEANPNSQRANNAVGTLYLLQMDLDPAVEHLEKAHAISYVMTTTLNLGEVYRYMGFPNNAAFMHNVGVTLLSEEGAEKARFTEDNGIAVFFLPYQRGDRETIKKYVTLDNLAEKQAIYHFSLAIDYALAGNFPGADQEFTAAAKLDGRKKFGDFFVNRSLSALNFLQETPESKAWFKKNVLRACVDKSLCEMANKL